MVMVSDILNCPTSITHFYNYQYSILARSFPFELTLILYSYCVLNVVSQLLVQMASQLMVYKIYNITKSLSQPQHYIIKCSNTKNLAPNTNPGISSLD